MCVGLNGKGASGFAKRQQAVKTSPVRVEEEGMHGILPRSFIEEHK